MGEQIAHASVTLVDDPLRARRLGSSPFDGEGWPASVGCLLKTVSCKAGCLTLPLRASWGLPTGNAGAGSAARLRRERQTG